MRERALGLLKAGMRTADVAADDRPCSGRPRVTTPAQDWYI
jgi:hypothetical protein